MCRGRLYVRVQALALVLDVMVEQEPTVSLAYEFRTRGRRPDKRSETRSCSLPLSFPVRCSWIVVELVPTL